MNVRREVREVQTPDIRFEICVDSIAGVRAAELAGAARVELCAGLIEGGITPSLGMIEAAAEGARVGVQVMIRPRGGDFVYSPEELAVMARDIAGAKRAGATGIVLGLLSPMRHRNPDAFMGGALRPPEFSRLETSEPLLRATIAAAKRGAA